MLEKNTGIHKIHQLRIIGIVEADPNTSLNKFFARHFVHNSEQSILAKDQLGGRPGCTASGTALRKLLAFDYGRSLHIIMTMFMNDTTAYFDRMVSNISSLISIKHNMPPKVMQSWNMTMEAMKHTVRMKYGDSTVSYKESEGTPNFPERHKGKAPLQASGAFSPTLFYGISVPPHWDQAPLCDQHNQHHKNNNGFVDDTVAMASVLHITYTASKTATCNHLEKSAQIWTNLINARGGAITYHKNLWQILTWHDGTFPPKLKTNSQSIIMLYNYVAHQPR